MELQGLKINFLGDSITAGSGVSCEEHIYLNRLKEEAGLAAARNYGIGGTRIAAQRGPDAQPPHRSYIERFGEMDDDADVVVVFGGTNDFGHGDAPLGAFDDRTAYTFYGACHLLMEGLIQKYPTAAIVFLTPLHRLGEDNPLGDGSRKEETVPLSVYAEAVRETARYYALPVLDLFAVSGIQPCVPAIRERYCPDGLHPNDEGHKRLTSRLAGFLRAL